jgi:hypothetical protein
LYVLDNLTKRFFVLTFLGHNFQDFQGFLMRCVWVRAYVQFYDSAVYSQLASCIREAMKWQSFAGRIIFVMRWLGGFLSQIREIR